MKYIFPIFHATMPYYGNPWFVALTENYLFRTN